MDQQAYKLLDAAVMRSAASRELAHDLAGDDPELGMVLEAVLEAANQAAVRIIVRFAQGGS